MAVEKWVTVKKHYCQILDDEAELLELRVYPAQVMPDTSGYQVKATKCSADVACNMMGCNCEWAYTNPGTDRFALT